MIEREIQDYYIAILKEKRIPFIHIPNTAHRKVKAKYDCFGESCLKHFPDIDFQFKGKRYQRELGIEGRHKGRKEKQLEKMRLYKEHGVNIAIITSMDAAEQDLRDIGVIE
jgi:hypothetical protein